MTHTYAILEVSPALYREVRESLETAAYEHAFHQDAEGEVIDMQGLALRARPAKKITSHRFVPCYLPNGCVRKDRCHSVDPHRALACGATREEHVA